MIFTPNATGALRLVGEAYPFAPGDRFLPPSTTTTRSTASASSPAPGAPRRRTCRCEAPDLRVADGLLERYLDEAGRTSTTCSPIPAQSNFSGVKHPLEWIELAHERGWDVLLDAAAFVPTNRLDLAPLASRLRRALLLQDVRLPDRASAACSRDATRSQGSTGPGSAAARSSPRSCSASWHVPPPGRALRGRHRQLPGPARRRDRAAPARVGSASRRSTPASRRSAPGCSTRSARCATRDGARAARVYGPPTWDRRGATIAFNFLHPDGRVVDERYVDRVAAEHSISLRTGCFCNPGAGEIAFTISQGHTGRRRVRRRDDPRRLHPGAIGMPSGGAVRASLGLVSNFADIQRFMAFAREFLDVTEVPSDLPPRLAC